MINGTTTIAVIADGCEILMGKRRDNGKWTLPGGGMNPKETPLLGAIRELQEETGIVASSLKPLCDEIVEGRTGRKVHVYCFRYDTLGVQTRTAQDPDQEVSQWAWVYFANGLPDDIKNNLQSPKNILLKHMGLL